MADIPDYSGLEAQWQADCHNWNSNITATNRRRPALSNQLPHIDLTVDDVASKVGGGEGTQPEIKVLGGG